MADHPRPKQVLVCSTCDQPWSKHIALAERELAGDHFYEEMPEVTAEDISYRHCIELLKLANQGPMGPMGPPGITGPTGQKGEKGDPGVVQFQKLPLKPATGEE